MAFHHTIHGWQPFPPQEQDAQPKIVKIETSGIVLKASPKELERVYQELDTGHPVTIEGPVGGRELEGKKVTVELK